MHTRIFTIIGARRLWAGGVILLTLITAATLAAGMGMKRGWFTAPSTKAAVAVQQREGFEVERVTIRRFGFEPSVIKGSSKDFTLLIVNRSYLPELAISLNRIVGNGQKEKVKDVRQKRGQVNGFNYFGNLPPGEYELVEANNPNWKCAITLTAR